MEEQKSHCHLTMPLHCNDIKKRMLLGYNKWTLELMLIGSLSYTVNEFIASCQDQGPGG